MPAKAVDPHPPVREPSLDRAVAQALAELEASAALHRDTLATVTIERAALAAQVDRAETELADTPAQSGQRKLVAKAVEGLRVRLNAADAVADVAGRALQGCQRTRDTLVAGLRTEPGHGAEHDGDTSARHVLQVIEDERMRIARDMHDGPAQLLANLVLKAEIVERCLPHPEMARDELHDFKAIVRHALEETRQLIFDLRPMTLDDLGLVPTLRKFVSDFEDRWEVPCRVQVIGVERRIEPEREAALFRIAQEAMNNARKHATPSTIDVIVALTPRRVTVTVTDDGRGFDVAATERRMAMTNHLGLISMRERAVLMGAVLDITSAEHRGTSVRVSLTT